MEDKITVISTEPAGKGKSRVTFDNGVTCLMYRGEMRTLQIREQAELSQCQYEFLFCELLGKRAKKRAMHLLEQMDRTEEQLRRKLFLGGYPQESIEVAVDYVKSYHYLDDYRYACNFVRLSQEKMSRQQLKMKLLQKGIARDTADRAIEAEYISDETSKIQALLEKRRYDPQNADENEQRKTYQFLLRRGFKNNDILRGMRFLT